MPASPQSLFKPFSHGALHLDNRIVMAPMTRFFSPGNVPGPEVADYYRRRAAGGVGLIVTEGTFVPHVSASNNDRIPNFHGEEALAGWKRVVSQVHAAGGKIMPQLWHVGIVYFPDEAEPEIGRLARDPVSPSGILWPDRKVAEPATPAEIDAVLQAFGEAARTAMDLGFDGIEIHGAHGYLLDQFLWPTLNRRTDRYGGPLQNRVRFGVELIRACRAATRPDFPIVLRYSQWKQQDFAARLAETPDALEALLAPFVEAGVDIFHCSQRRFWEPEFPGSGLNLAGWTRKLTGKPTITVGSVGLDGEFMTGLLEKRSSGVAPIDALVERLDRDEFDLVAVGRALIANPDWPEKVRRQAYADLRPYSPDVLETLE